MQALMQLARMPHVGPQPVWAVLLASASAGPAGPALVGILTLAGQLLAADLSSPDAKVP